MILLAIDPGADTGWARFFNGSLEACGLGTPPIIKAAAVVIECPEYRAHDRINPNDLITLAVKVGREVERAFKAGITATLVRPTEWKGSVPKRIHQPRILCALNEEECEHLNDVLSMHAKTKGHNIVDAVGIGLHYLGRLSR